MKKQKPQIYLRHHTVNRPCGTPWHHLVLLGVHIKSVPWLPLMFTCTLLQICNLAFKAVLDMIHISVSQGTLPPPYSSAVPSEANCSQSSPLSTMTSQSSSASSLSKQRQSWLDLVAQGSTASIGEAPAVRSVQVHLHQPPPEEEEAPEWWAPPELAGTGSGEEGAAKGETSGVVDQGETLL